MKIILTSIAIVVFCYIAWFWAAYPDSNLRVIMCDVGQGDSILIQRSFIQVLVDGGPNNQVLNCLGEHLPMTDTQLELVVLTHPQNDHLYGLIEVLERYSVKNFISSNAVNSTESYYRLRRIIEEKRINDLHLQQGMSITIDQVRLDFLWPESNTSVHSNTQDLNASSLVFEVNFGDFSALFTGDIGKNEESALVASGLLTKVDLLKVPHHGSKHSSNMGFLRSVNPSISLISAGKKSRFGHPHEEVLERLSQLKTQVLGTYDLGDIIVVSNGERYWLE